MRSDVHSKDNRLKKKIFHVQLLFFFRGIPFHQMPPPTLQSSIFDQETYHVPFLCAVLRLGHTEDALGGLLDILWACRGTGLCGLVMLDIWIFGKDPGGGNQIKHR